MSADLTKVTHHVVAWNATEKRLEAWTGEEWVHLLPAPPDPQSARIVALEKELAAYKTAVQTLNTTLPEVPSGGASHYHYMRTGYLQAISQVRMVLEAAGIDRERM